MPFPYLQAAALLYGAFRYFTKPKPKSTAYKGGNIEVTATTNTVVPLVYGNAEVTGNIIYKEDTTSATNHLAVGLCEGEINAIESVRINGVNIPVSPETYEGCSYTPYLGTAAQTADARFTSSTMTVGCTANAFVDEGEPDTVQSWWSYQSRLYIEDDNGDDQSKYTYLKFDISGLNVTTPATDISSAYLRLFKNSVSMTSNHTVYFYEMTDDSWDEATLKWSNKPAFGDQITTVSGSLFNTTQEYVDIDVTQWVQDTYAYDAAKIVGIGIAVVNSSSGVAQAVFAARDSAGAPVLRIGYAPKELAAFAHTAYVALTIVDSALFKGHINEIKVSVQGKLINDGDVSPNYSRTPAWIVYDLLTSARYGADIPTSLINASSFTSVASYNDTAITNEDGGDEPRHRCDVVFDEKDSVADRINAVLASFGGYLYTLDGKINLGVDSSGSSSHTFTMDNIIAGSFNFWMIDKSQAPNDISVMYYDAANDFKASYVNVKDQDLIDSYGRNFEDLQLVCINRYSQASRMALYYLNKTKLSTYGCSFRVSINHLNVAPGDICDVTHTVPGWSAKDFRIISVVEASNDELEVTCEEYDSDLYDDEGLPYSPPEGSTLPNPTEIPPVVTDLSLTETYSLGDDGTYIPQISVTWTAPDYQFPLQFIVWYKLHSTATYKYWELSTDAAAVISVPSAAQYDVRIQTVNQLSGIKTDFGTSPGDTITLAGKTAPPSDVTFNDINSTYYNKVYVEWLPVTDNDLAYYELRTDTNWGNATNRVWTGIATSFILQNPTEDSYTFYIKAKDLTGNYSANDDDITLTKADPVLGTVTVEFSGKDCYVNWDHAYDEAFERYKVDVYSDAARTTKVHTGYVNSPPYIYSYELNKSTNSGTPIRHPYFTITVTVTAGKYATQNADDDNAAPTAPTGLTVTPGTGKLFIKWDAIAANDIIGYNVYAKTTSPANTLVGTVNATNFTFDPEGENTYYVTVAGVDWFGEGTKCSEETQTTNPYALTNYTLDVPLTRGIGFTVSGGKAKWTTGTLYYEGSAYTIAAETTGTTNAFIYWDKDSPTAYQSSATAPALDDDVWVMAYFDGTDVYQAFAQKVIHGGLIQADSISADKLAVTELSAITATTGTIQTASSGQRVVIDGATNTLKFYVTGATEAIKLDDNINSSGAPGMQISSTVGGRIYMVDSDTAGNNNTIRHNGIDINSSAGGTPLAVYQIGEETTNAQVRISYMHPSVGYFIEGYNGAGKKFSISSDGDIASNKITTVDDVKTGDKLIFDRANDVTIDATSPASGPLTYTIPDAGAAASFVMSDGNQNVDGVKTFLEFPITPSSAPTTDYMAANKKYVDDNAGGSHAVLSATHTDSTASAVSRGSIITGQGATPKWAELNIGTNGYYLKSDGTDVLWAAVTAGAAGSDTQVQFNDGGTSLGGDAGLVYNKTTDRLTSKAFLATGDTFTTSTTDSVQDGIMLQTTQDVAEDNYGASIAFCRQGGASRRAAIVSKQHTSDGDQIGLSIFTHPSGTSTDPLVEAIEIDHNGHITLLNNATVFKILSVSLLSCKLRGVNDPDLAQLASNTGTVGVYAYKFIYGATREVFGSIRIPQDYKSGTTIYVHINRMLEVAPDNTTDNFRIGLEYTWCEEDGTMASTTTAETTFDCGSDSATKLIRTELGSISGSGHVPGGTLMFRLYREAAASPETESYIFITSIDFEYESDKLGSNATTV